MNRGDVEQLVDTFPGQSIDFFGALRARVYDDMVRKWITDNGVEAIGAKLVNSKAKVAMTKVGRQEGEGWRGRTHALGGRCARARVLGSLVVPAGR